MEPTRAQDGTQLRVAFVPAAPALALWVAQDKGFFKAQHLDVSMSPVQNVGLIPNALGKQFDVGTATTVDLIKAAAGGLNVAAVAGNHFETEQATTNALVARKESGVRSVKDLAGKTVATPAIGAILHVALLHWLRKDGVDVNRVRFVEVPFPNMTDQMEAGRIDAATAAEPFAGRMIAAGNTSLGNGLLQVANPSLATVWMSDRAWAQANQPTIAAWTAALRQAASFIVQEPKEAREILAKYTKLPPPVIEHLALPHFETKVQASDLEVWIKVLTEVGQLQKPMDANTLLATAK
jgi:NitT/TauT family transport system substrate-binding protein